MASRLTFSYATDTPAKIGAELRAIRQHLGISQRRFAAQLGAHRTSVARWEAGVRPTPIATLRLARFLAEAHVAPSTFMPNPRAKPVSLLPGCECWWQHYGEVKCAGAQYQLECVVSRQLHIIWQTRLFPVKRQEAHGVGDAGRGKRILTPTPPSHVRRLAGQSLLCSKAREQQVLWGLVRAGATPPAAGTASQR